MDAQAVSEEYVTSRDGTRIGYLRRGSGPGLLLIQGAMATAHNYHDLAEALSTTFTVYTPDRRGRGMSAKPYDPTHELARDVEDVDAILAETGSSKIFGLSSGAMIVLEAARTLPRITQAAVYEPPFYLHGISHEGVRQLNEEIERGQLAAAMVTSLNVLETLPPTVSWLPGPLARLLAGGVLWAEGLRSSPYAHLRDLVPTIRYDFNIVESMDGKMDTLATIEKPILLLSGSKSPAYLRESTRRLHEILPRSTHVELQRLDHSGSWNSDYGGSPLVVADALRDFFT